MLKPLILLKLTENDLQIKSSDNYVKAEHRQGPGLIGRRRNKQLEKAETPNKLLMNSEEGNDKWVVMGSKQCWVEFHFNELQ